MTTGILAVQVEPALLRSAFSTSVPGKSTYHPCFSRLRSSDLSWGHPTQDFVFGLSSRSGCGSLVRSAYPQVPTTNRANALLPAAVSAPFGAFGGFAAAVSGDGVGSAVTPALASSLVVGLGGEAVGEAGGLGSSAASVRAPPQPAAPTAINMARTIAARLFGRVMVEAVSYTHLR